MQFKVGDKVHVARCRLNIRNGIIGRVTAIHKLDGQTDGFYVVGGLNFYADELDLIIDIWIDLEQQIENAGSLV